MIDCILLLCSQWQFWRAAKRSFVVELHAAPPRPEWFVRIGRYLVRVEG